MSKWIKCDKNLPAKSENVLILTIKREVLIACISESGIWCADDRFVTTGGCEHWYGGDEIDSKDVTHWQPLPSPPEDN